MSSIIPCKYYVLYQVEGEPSTRTFSTIAESPEHAANIFNSLYLFRGEKPPEVVQVMDFRQYYREFHEGEV